ncbi:NAD(P)/FAD-dependent oxidoreductase [Martelella alba]|uniref:FAD-binding oxidoreductase n=1 Tax=Martelella alba TaxID=2590451 RepID=A0ABY2SMV0_9HYPH|nr:FAD-dependent oxidoreductase [Martelella alba]TKI06997.1 FAD-binding oxidoreductase [Martelella alba]
MDKRLDGKIDDVYWAIVSQEKISLPARTDKDDYDLVIVGAGYCGLSTALHAAKKGLSVLVLDESSVGSGASGRNGGAVVPTFPGALTVEDVKNTLGAVKGEKYAQLVNTAPDYLFEQITRYGIQCHPKQNGFIQPGHSEKSLYKIQKVYQSWQKRGVDIHWLSGDEVKENTGAHGYLGGWYQKSGGTVEPYALAQGLARAALDAGADILENHRVASIAKVGGGYQIASSKRVFKGKKVLIATNAYTQNLLRPLGKSVIPVRLYHTMTRPLTEQERRVVLPKGITFTDLRKSGGFGRLDSFGRLQSGGAVFTPTGKEYGMAHARLRMQELFPSLAGIELEYYWEGYCAITEEWVPSLQIHDVDFYSFIGFSTRGVALSFSVGRILAELISGELSHEDSPLFVCKNKILPLHAIKEYLGGWVFPFYKARDRLKLT